MQHLLIEARAANLNRRDIATVQGTRFALPKGSRFRVDHIPGSAEPLLWVAGVVRASRQGSPVQVELTGERVHVLEVPTNC